MLGKGTGVDLKKAAHWHKKAADLPSMKGGIPNIGVAHAQHSLGLIYLDGLGIPKAINCKCSNLISYSMHIGEEKNTDLALHFFKKAAANGFAGSLSSLGGLYQIGELVPQNLEMAHSYYMAAAAKGSSE